MDSMVSVKATAAAKTADIPNAAEALAEAEAERRAAAERYGVDHEAKPPKLPRAVRQQIRRAKLRPVNVDLTIDQGAKLDRLVEVYGTQRAAIGALIDQAELPDE